MWNGYNKGFGLHRLRDGKSVDIADSVVRLVPAWLGLKALALACIRKPTKNFSALVQACTRAESLESEK
jgi:hypothetical protein